MSKMILTKEGLVKEGTKVRPTKENTHASITNEQLKNLVKEVIEALKNIQK